MNHKYFYYLLFFLFLITGCATKEVLVKDTPIPAEEVINYTALRHYENGALYDFQNEYEKALLEYYQALAYDSNSAQIYKAIGRDMLRLRKSESGLKYLKKSLKINPDDLETLNYLAEAYYGQKDFSESKRYYEEILDKNPYNTSIQNNLAYLYSQTKDFDGLLKFYQRMARAYPEDSERHLQYAISLMQHRKLDEAKRELKTIIQKDSTNNYAKFVLGNLYEAERDTVRAVASYQKILKEKSDYGDALDRLHRIYRAQKNWEGIENIYAPLVDQDSTNMQALIVLAETYYIQRKSAEARKVLVPILNHPEFRPAALELLGRISFETEEFEDAKSYFTLLTQEYPSDRFGWIFLTIIHNRDEAYQKSITTLQNALNHHPKDVDILGMYGNSLELAGRTEDAIKPLVKVLEIDSSDANAIGSLATIYDKLNMWHKSDSLYKKGIMMHPENALLLNNYSYSLCERGIALDSAKQLVEKALQLDPQNGAYLDTYGRVYYRLGDYEKALLYLEQALKFHEESAEVLEHVGDVHLRLNNTAEARSFYRKALEKDPENIQLKQKIQGL